MSKGRFDDLVDRAYYSNEREIQSRVVVQYNLPRLVDVDVENVQISDKSLKGCDPYGTFDNDPGNIKKIAVHLGFKLDGTYNLVDDMSDNSITQGSNFISSDMRIIGLKKEKLNDKETSYTCWQGESYKINGSNIVDEINNITIMYGSYKLKKYTVTLSNDESKSTATIDLGDNYSSTIIINKSIIDLSLINNKECTLSITYDEFVTDYNIGEKAQIIYLPTHINKMMLGLVDVFEGNEIIDMNVIIQSKKFCEEVPEDEISFTIGNYENKFDMLDKDSKAQLLSSKTKFIPYLGVKAGDDFEFERLGYYYFDKLETSEDNVKFTGKSAIALIKDLNLNFTNATSGDTNNCINLLLGEIKNIDMQGSLYFSLNNIVNNANNECEIRYQRDNLLENSYLGSWQIATQYNKSKSLLEYLQKLAIASGCHIYSERLIEAISINPLIKYNGEKIETDEEVCYDIITLDDMLEEPKVNKIDKINKIIIKQPNQLIQDVDNNVSYIQLKIEKVIEKDYETILVNFDSRTIIKEEQELLEKNDIALSDEFNFDDGSFITYIQSNDYMIFLNSKLPKGEKYSRTINIANLSDSEATFEYSNKTNENDKDITLEIENEFIPYINLEDYYDNTKKMAQYYLDNATQYEVSFECFGNARISPGETIKVQTRHGYIYTWVEKVEFNFDGGLTCKIEGVSTGGFVNE